MKVTALAAAAIVSTVAAQEVHQSKPFIFHAFYPDPDGSEMPVQLCGSGDSDQILCLKADHPGGPVETAPFFNFNTTDTSDDEQTHHGIVTFGAIKGSNGTLTSAGLRLTAYEKLQLAQFHDKQGTEFVFTKDAQPGIFMLPTLGRPENDQVRKQFYACDITLGKKANVTAVAWLDDTEDVDPSCKFISLVQKTIG